MSAEERSIAFDRAASFYDHTRQLSSEGAKRVSELLAGEIRDRHPVLEIGVGTGRIALPLHQANGGVVGLDLSAPMLEKLVANAGGTMPFPLVRGDASRLPFCAGSFGADREPPPAWAYAVKPPDFKPTPDNGQMVTAKGCTPISSADPQIAAYRKAAGTG